jgi:hypothetical protein
LTKSFLDSGSGFLSGWLHSTTYSEKWLSNVGARTERGRGGTGRNSLFEGELVVGLLDLGRVSILLDPAEFASIREKASERGEKRACGGGGDGYPRRS